MEEELEEDLDEEDNLDGALDFFRSMPGRRSISRDKVSNKFGGVPFEQGETLDFLNFLRGANYDHRQCPNEVEADIGTLGYTKE